MLLAVVVPFLNEARHLGTMLESLARQTRPPEEILLVDDGSSDGSLELAHAFARDHPHATVLRRPVRPASADRLAGAHELRAFKWAIGHVREPWTVIGKLDADLELPAGTLAAIVGAMEADAALGMAGTFLREQGPDGVTKRLRISSDHVHGATKFYRRECWEAIAPVPEILGWDTIDEVTARLNGWHTVSVAIPGGDPLHLRPRATYDGRLRGYRRMGECAWGIGEAPLHVAAFAVREMRERPLALGGLNYAAGWASAGLRRRPRAAAPVRAAVRSEQLRRIRRRLRRAGGG